MRRINRAFTDFAISFGAPKQAKFSAAFMACFLLDRALNFGLGSLCEIRSCPISRGSIEHPGDLLPVSAFADVGQRLGLFLDAIIGVLRWDKAGRHNPVDFGASGREGFDPVA